MNFLSSDRTILSKLKHIRLIATDMDGTLTSQGKFTPILLQALTDLAQAGKQVVIVTGRSAGWVSGLASYLPVAGAIAENGGLFYPSHTEHPVSLTPIADFLTHRQQLQDTFSQLKTQFPNLQESVDNQFRLTDWTFDVQGLSTQTLQQLNDQCQQLGWGFTYSSVQCHIMRPDQDKARGLLQVLGADFPDYTPSEIITVGDSPNDQSLFNPRWFPNSVGVANIREYTNQLLYQPAYITQAAEGLGFCELAQLLA